MICLLCRKTTTEIAVDGLRALHDIIIVDIDIPSTSLLDLEQKQGDSRMRGIEICFEVTTRCVVWWSMSLLSSRCSLWFPTSPWSDDDRHNYGFSVTATMFVMAYRCNCARYIVDAAGGKLAATLYPSYNSVSRKDLPNTGRETREERTETTGRATRNPPPRFRSTMSPGEPRGPPRRAQTSSPSGFSSDDHQRGIRHGTSPPTSPEYIPIIIVDSDAFRTIKSRSSFDSLSREPRRTHPFGPATRPIPTPRGRRVS